MKKLGIIVLASFFFAGSKPDITITDIEGLGNFHEKASVYPFQPGEKLEYRIHYGFINAGIASLEVKKDYERPFGFHVIGEGKTTGAFDWVFKVRDTYETFMDALEANPYKFKRRVNEGGYKIKRDYTFFQDRNQIDNGRHKDLVEAPVNIQDVLSAFYYARTLDFSDAQIGDILTVYTYLDFEFWPMKVRYAGVEDVEVDGGEFNCMKFVPVVQEGRVFKDEETVAIWITNDHNKIPIMAEAEILIGSIKMELTDYNGIKNHLAKV